MQATDRTPAPAPGKAQQKNITNPLIKIKMEHAAPKQAVQDDYDFCTATARAALAQAEQEETPAAPVGLIAQEELQQLATTPIAAGLEHINPVPYGQMSACSPVGCDRPGGCWCKVQDFSRAAQPFKPNFNL